MLRSSSKLQGRLARVRDQPHSATPLETRRIIFIDTFLKQIFGSRGEISVSSDVRPGNNKLLERVQSIRYGDEDVIADVLLLQESANYKKQRFVTSTGAALALEPAIDSGCSVDNE